MRCYGLAGSRIFFLAAKAMWEVRQKITACSSTAASANENSPLFSPLCWRPLGSDAEVRGITGLFHDST
jgi:hypothetical protein